jgi:hypothetical protein
MNEKQNKRKKKKKTKTKAKKKQTKGIENARIKSKNKRANR